MTPPLPLEFALTDEEAGVAAARTAWRAALSDGLVARHLAPLAAFALWTLFAGILGFTGLAPQRPTEIALILGAAAYMSYRLWTRRGFLLARRSAAAWVEQVRAAGAVRLTFDEAGIELAGASRLARLDFADGFEIENAGGMIYVWPRRGRPLFWPARAEPDPGAAAQRLAYVSGRVPAA